MTGVGALAGASGDAQTRALSEDARRARVEHDAAQAADPPPAEARTTESAVKETEFGRQDHEREQAEQEAPREQDPGSLLDVVA